MTCRTAIVVCLILFVGFTGGVSRAQEKSEPTSDSPFPQRIDEGQDALLERLQGFREGRVSNRKAVEERRRKDKEFFEKLENEGVTIEPGDDELLKLQKQRYNVAAKEVHARLLEYRGGQAPIDAVCKACARMIIAKLAITDEPEAVLKAHDQAIAIAAKLEESAKLNFQAGLASVQEFYRAQYLRLDAEIARLKYKRSMDPK